MASFLVPQKNKEDFLSTAFSLVTKGETYRVVDRLLAGAAQENVPIPLLILQIDQYEKWKKGSEINMLSQMVEGLTLILVDHTPQEVVVDCINPNEFLVMLPSRNGEQTAQFGNEVINRFTQFSQELMKSKRKKCTLSGGISVFPDDAKNRIELFQNARNALKEAIKKRDSEVIDNPLIEYTPQQFDLTDNQIKQLGSLGKKLNMDQSMLVREAVDDLFLKYL